MALSLLNRNRDNDPSQTKTRLRDSDKVKPDGYVDDRLKRGRDRTKEQASKRNECLAFARGDQHLYEGKDGLILKPMTASQGKEPWRVRQVRNALKDVIEHEVSAGTQRVPSYSVTPSTFDPEDIAAASIAEQVALYGYEQWNLRTTMERVVSYAVIADEGYAWAFFNNQVGDPMGQDADGNDIATGEVEIRVLGPNEVYSEPGVQFEDSRWYAVEQARPLEDVYAMTGYMGGKLDANANTSDMLNKQQKSTNMVIVTEYLERPSAKNGRKGRWLTMANGHLIVPEKPYPLLDPKGRVCDESVLVRLSYFVDPSSEKGEGLVRHLLDSQRTINDCVNKLLEWKNLALVPRIFAPKGMFDEGMIITDEPGSVYEVNPVSGQNGPTFAPTPQIPQELFQLIEMAKGDIANISAQNSIPNNVDTAKGISALIEKDQQRRARFHANLAQFHGRLMERCLYLVQRGYSEPRLLLIHGTFGAARIPDFLGAQMLGQCDVRVATSSIEPRTRESVEQRVMGYADRGWISPQRAMAAIDAGIAESLVDDYDANVQRANLLIQKLRAGREHFMSNTVLVEGPTRTDPVTGAPLPPMEVPDWMPREFDNAALQMSVFARFMLSPEYDSWTPEQKTIANQIYGGYKKQVANQQAEAAAAQAAVAQSMGNANAAKPAAPPAPPTQPGEQPPKGV